MHRVSYVPGTGGEAVGLDGEIAYIGTGTGLRSYEWTYQQFARSVHGFRVKPRTVTVELTAQDSAIDALRDAASADAYAEEAGTLTVDDWSIGCYIVAATASEALPDGWGAVKLKLLLLDGFWWREKSRHFVTGLSDDGIDHPYDHPHDLSFSAGKGTVNVSTALGAKPRITFYGPCTNPYIVIGDNRYEVDVQVLSTQVCVIDATGDTPTVKRVDNQGNAESVFPYAVREGGRGGGSYAFEPLPQGDLQVAWSGAFSFDVAWRELETEPPWSR